ncbi:MAG TPA: glycosyltransferase [Luteolibacter sp.]|nr:glycosyltransferase [Luteolibacter sp.]
MKIAMFTNTYLPHVGGVARSVKTLEDECRKLGHDVRVIAPESDAADESPDVLRVPAIQNFNGSDFSVRLPFPNKIRDFIDEFQPDIIHSHHPFLLGDAALREAWKSGVPIVFTHHTLYERYTHYVPLDSDALKRVAIQLATEYCNLCTHVIAPSDSIAKLLLERGVKAPVTSIPTGIDTQTFSSADGAGFRARYGISSEQTVIGHVGRLAEEKNLGFLAEAVGEVLERHPDAVFLLVGDGPAKEAVEARIPAGRIIATGSLHGQDLADAYAAMDIFAFASQSETQGMVLAEAMAAGVPVVALDGPGVREILFNDRNGVLLDGDADSASFADALSRLISEHEFRGSCSEQAAIVSEEYDRAATTARIIDLYESLIAGNHREPEDSGPWDRLLNGVQIEWEIAAARISAVAAVVSITPATEVAID